MDGWVALRQVGQDEFEVELATQPVASDDEKARHRPAVPKDDRDLEWRPGWPPMKQDDDR